MSDQDVIENPNHRTVVEPLHGLPTIMSSTPDGNKRSGPSLRESVSKRSNSPHGFSTYVRNFRSVLHHPVGLPLIRAFHTKTAKEKGGGGDGDGEDEKKKEEFPLIKEYFPDFFEGRGGSATAASANAAADVDGGVDPPCATAATAASATAAIPVDDIFQSCHILWRSEGKPTELALTKKLAEAMASSLREYNVAVRGEAPVPDPRTFGTARIDVLVSKRMKGVDGTEADRPLLVAEVGLDNKLWWAKVVRSLKYMKYTQNLGGRTDQDRVRRPIGCRASGAERRRPRLWDVSQRQRHARVALDEGSRQFEPPPRDRHPLPGGQPLRDVSQGLCAGRGAPGTVARGRLRARGHSLFQHGDGARGWPF
jgi:hypothetical protein